MNKKCSECDYSSSCRSNLSRHSKSKHKGVRHSCSECDYSSSCRSNLLKHSKAKHQGVSYSCSECDFNASYKGDLLRHSKSRHKGVVNQNDNTKNNFVRHSESMHKERKSKTKGIKYSCDQCDFEAPEKSHISFHVKYIHEGLTYPCPLYPSCEYRASLKNDLEKHMGSIHRIKHEAA